MSLDDRLRLAWAGLHPDRRARLVSESGSAGAAVARLVAGAGSEAARRAVEVDPDRRRAQLDRLGVALVARGRAGYPAWLAQLPDGPDLLFCRGTLPAGPAVAVVGTRAATRYGRSLARTMGAGLARRGYVVVSGLARGIDGAAHRGVVDAGGVGVAVLGSGPDVWYPAEHRSLGEQLIGAGGAVVTEYPPGTPPEPWRFPPRNRIISGLAAVVVIVEARVEGGALITARRALDQGREVFAVPGDVDRVSSEGCNRLIRDGALPVLGADDLLEAVDLVLPAPVAPPPTSGSDRPLLEILGDTGQTLDDLAERMALPIGEVTAAVARLEVAGRVRIEGGWVTATG